VGRIFDVGLDHGRIGTHPAEFDLTALASSTQQLAVQRVDQPQDRTGG